LPRANEGEQPAPTRQTKKRKKQEAAAQIQIRTTAHQDTKRERKGVSRKQKAHTRGEEKRGGNKEMTTNGGRRHVHRAISATNVENGMEVDKRVVMKSEVFYKYS